MEFLLIPLLGLSVVVGIGSLVCFIMVIVKMFQAGDSQLAIISLVLILCGIGPLIAFVMGWIKVNEYGIKNLMLAWTGCFIGSIVIQIATMVISVGAAAANGGAGGGF